MKRFTINETKFMANKMSLLPLAPATLKGRMSVGSINVDEIAVGFIVTGKTSGGTTVTKPVSKKEFIDKYAERYETKSQAVKAFYNSLRIFTQAAQADFNARVTKGDRITAVKSSESGRMNYGLAQPKADTAGSAGANESLSKENAQLKAALGAMQTQMNELIKAMKSLNAPAAE